MGESTTVTVDRADTFPELSERRRAMSGNGPGERASMDDVISDLLFKARAFEALQDEEGEAEGASV